MKRTVKKEECRIVERRKQRKSKKEKEARRAFDAKERKERKRKEGTRVQRTGWKSVERKVVEKQEK